jgi:tellurite resistance protein TehA-like permease
MPEDITPPYWINVGAVGITTLAGATILQHISTTDLADTIPFIKGISVLAWATSTWWMPIIILLEVWKYLIKKVPLTYTPQLWSPVFCLGTYTVATFKLSRVLEVPYMQAIAEVFIYAVFVVGALVGLGMCYDIIKTFARGSFQKPD